MLRVRHVASSALASLGFALLAGCTASGPATFDVKGKLTIAGKPLEVKKINGQRVGILTLWVVKDDGPDPLGKRSATVQDDGTFLFEGLTKPLAGKHRVCIEWKDEFGGPDKLNKKFDEKNSKIFRKFPDDSNIDIDVSKPEG